MRWADLREGDVLLQTEGDAAWLVLSSSEEGVDTHDVDGAWELLRRA